MAAYAEGFNHLETCNVGKQRRETDAETTHRCASLTTINTISIWLTSRKFGGAAALSRRGFWI